MIRLEHSTLLVGKGVAAGARAALNARLSLTLVLKACHLLKLSLCTLKSDITRQETGPVFLFPSYLIIHICFNPFFFLFFFQLVLKRTLICLLKSEMASRALIARRAVFEFIIMSRQSQTTSDISLV